MDRDVTFQSAHESDELWVIRDRVRFRGHVPGTNVALLEVQVPPGAGVPLHRHQSPEMFRILSGELVLTHLEGGGERRRVARAGDVMTVPSNTPHGYANESGDAAEILVALDSSMLEFFRELGEPNAASGPPTPQELERVGRACEKHGIAFVQSMANEAQDRSIRART